jgi:dGTPase
VNLLREEAPFFGQIYANVTMQYPWAPAKLQFSEALRHMLDSLVTDVIQHTEQQVRGSGVQTAEEVRLASARLAGLSENGRAQNAMLKTFLFRHVYNLPVITEDSDRSVRCLEDLFIYYLQKPHSMPETHEEMARETPRHVVVCDYIAGMTDQFLLRQHQEQFGSSASSVSSIARPQRIE